MKTTCPFCEENIEEITFLTSPNFRVIYNKAPVLPGHSMVIPKSHINSMLGLSKEQRHEMIELSISAVKILLNVFHANAFNWTIQEGTEAGQTIPHLHMHLIPRKENDLPNPGDWYPRLESQYKENQIDSEARPKHSFEEMKEIVQYIRTYISEQE